VFGVEIGLGGLIEDGGCLLVGAKIGKESTVAAGLGRG